MRIIKVLLFTLLCGGGSVFGQAKKAVMILLDGIPADVLERVETPHLDAIAREGGYTRAYVGGEKGGETETPTISAPGYMNMITGVWGNKHNVWGNGVKDPNYDYWNIFRIAEASDDDLQTAIFSTWLDNRTKLIGEGKPEAGNVQLDFAFDGFEHDTITFPHLPDRRFIYDIDEYVSKRAAQYIRTDGPDLSWVYLEFTDDMGHKYGDSEHMDDAVRKADAQVGRVWRAVKYREQSLGEQWMLVVTTDHGRQASDGKGHGGQSDRERITWIVTNVSELKSRFSENPPIVDITPSICSFMGLSVPKEIRDAWDGRSFVSNQE